LYEYGQHHGVIHDLDASFHCYKSAAESGWSEGCALVAECYFEGRGCERDLKQARYWLARAAAAGHEGIQQALRDIDYINNTNTNNINTENVHEDEEEQAATDHDDLSRVFQQQF
jgi:TPR repeat protein